MTIVASSGANKWLAGYTARLDIVLFSMLLGDFSEDSAWLDYF